MGFMYPVQQCFSSHIQIDGGKRVRIESQYHIYIWDIGVQCGFEPETEELESVPASYFYGAR